VSICAILIPISNGISIFELIFARSFALAPFPTLALFSWHSIYHGDLPDLLFGQVNTVTGKNGQRNGPKEYFSEEEGWPS
jgi:hypothetical protein